MPDPIERSEILAYADPQPPAAPAVHPLTMVVLALPGTYCWSVFFRAVLLSGYVAEFEAGLALSIWVLAVFFAIFSFLYVRHWRIWYVGLCLLINSAGLLFTVWFFYTLLGS